MTAEKIWQSWHAAEDSSTIQLGGASKPEARLECMQKNDEWSCWLAVERTREETVDVCLIVLIGNALQGATSL